MNKKVVGILMGLVAMGAMASAAPVSCTSQASWTLVNSSVTNGNLFSDIGAFSGGTPTDSCSAYGLTFSNFSVYINAGFAPSTPFSLTLSFLGNGSLVFGSNLIPGEDINLQYEITPGIPLEILSSSGPTGTGVSETVCSQQQTIPGGTCGHDGDGGVVLGSGFVNASGSTLISIAGSPSGHDWIFKDVSGTSAFTEQVVPEPVTLSMMGIGLLGLGLLRRRQVKK